ncbi:MAG: KEOPS complex subunit Pcc1 [Candidatus Nitrosocaldus sp.]
MISSINATIEVEYYSKEEVNDSIARSIYVALEPECRASSKSKGEDVRIGIVLDGVRVRLSIDTGDISTLRAVLNSYLRFVDAAYRSLTITR